MRRYFILCLLVVAATVSVLAQGPQGQQIPANPVSAGHIASVTGIGEVFGDGLKLSAIAIEMDAPVVSKKLKTSDFAINWEGNTLPASGKVTRVYANQAPEKADKGVNGKYVVLEMATDEWLPVSGETPELRMLQNNRGNRGPQANRPQPAATDFLADVSFRGNPDAHPSIRLSNRHGGQGFTFAVRQENALKAADGSVLETSGQWVDNEKDITLVLDGFAKPDFHNEENGVTSKFNLFVPYNYDPEKSYPLVVYLHDEYACWNRHDEPLVSGKGASLWATPEMQARQEAFVLVPVFKRTWLTSSDMKETGLDETVRLIDKVCATFRIDHDRMYLIGQGANAAAAMALQEAWPSTFAGAVCVAGAWNGAKSWDNLKNENILFIATEGDTEGVGAIESCLENLGGTSDHILYRKATAAQIVPQGFEKNALKSRVFTLRRAYDDGSVADWLYAQRRPAAQPVRPRGGMQQGSAVKPTTLNPTGTVTIRYQAPASVKEVMLNGDMLPMTVSHDDRWGDRENFAPVQMSRTVEGWWEYITPKLTPDLYKYWFTVDGINTIDMNNLYVLRGNKTDNANYFIVNDGASADFITQDVPHGTVSARWYHSDHFAQDRRMLVYTPAGYESSEENYPVLYILHGASEDETAWLTQGRMVEIMDNLIARGACKPMIVVAPDGDLEYPAALSLLNYDNAVMPHMNDVQSRRIGKTDFDYYENERFFPEIISFVDSNYRTVAAKQGRAVCGVSMGGRYSMNVSRLNRNTFDYVGLFSPALEPENHFPQAKYDDEIIASLRRQAEDGVALYWIGVGNHDMQWQTNIPFRAILDEVGLKYSFNPSGGAHTYNNWRIYLTKFAAELFK